MILAAAARGIRSDNPSPRGGRIIDLNGILCQMKYGSYFKESV
jgi:hypothetical protein